MIDVEKISKEHAELFPRADAESQLVKLEEEIREVKEAKTIDKIIREYADVAIVCIGLYRWYPQFSMMMLHLLKLENYFNWDKIEDEIVRKWEVNMNRPWVWNGKTYKHKNKDGNE